jgi:hypothetical protein
MSSSSKHSTSRLPRARSHALRFTCEPAQRACQVQPLVRRPLAVASVADDASFRGAARRPRGHCRVLHPESEAFFQTESCRAQQHADHEVRAGQLAQDPEHLPVRKDHGHAPGAESSGVAFPVTRRPATVQGLGAVARWWSASVHRVARPDRGVDGEGRNSAGGDPGAMASLELSDAGQRIHDPSGHRSARYRRVGALRPVTLHSPACRRRPTRWCGRRTEPAGKGRGNGRRGRMGRGSPPATLRAPRSRASRGRAVRRVVPLARSSRPSSHSRRRRVASDCGGRSWRKRPAVDVGNTAPPAGGWGAGRERRVQYVPRERATARIIGGAGRPDESASPASAGPLQAAGKYHPPGSLARGAEPTGGAPVSVPSVRSVASCSVFMK